MMRPVKPKKAEIKKRRLHNALWAMFIGDALAMPAHWYYSLENIQKVFDNGVRGYIDPPKIPGHLIEGLIAHEDIKHEIDAFIDIALSGKGI